MEALITPAIAVLMYAMFLQIPLFRLGAALRDRRFLAALLLANFVFVPLLAWGLTAWLAGHPALLIGALLVLLTPCIDYVVVFTHLGKGDSKLVLAATPLLLLLQFALLPVYLSVMLPSGAELSIPFAPFRNAFLLLIAAPLALAGATQALATRSVRARTWQDLCLWLPVPAMALVLLLVIASQAAAIAHDTLRLLPVVPVYIAFALLAPIVGALAARILRLPAPAARAVAFSAATRNSLVVLPLALVLPAELRTLAATAVITQTVIELIAELLYVRVIPRAIGRDRA